MKKTSVFLTSEYLESINKGFMSNFSEFCPPRNGGQCCCLCGMRMPCGNEELQELVMLVRSQHRQELLSCAQMLEQSLGQAVKSPFLEIFKAWLDEVMNNLMEFLLMEGVPAHGRM